MTSPIEIIKSNGIKIYSESADTFRVAASFRNSEDPNIIVNKEDGSAYDFARSEKYSFQQLLSMFGVSVGIEFTNPRSKSNVLVSEDSVESSYSKDYLQLFKQYKYWNDRGIGDTVLALTDGGVCHRGAFYRYFVFPIYNENDRIIGYSGRDTTGKKSKKWLHDGKSSKFLYGPYLKYKDRYPIQNAIQELNSVYLVESIGDCISMWQAGVWNAISVFGLNVSKSIISYCLAMDVKVTISFNNDKNFAGQSGAVKVYTKLSEFIESDMLSIRLSSSNKDFNDMLVSNDNISEWVKGRDNVLEMFESKLFLSKKGVCSMSMAEKKLMGNLK